MSHFSNLDIQRQNEQKELLDRLAERGEVLDYIIETFKGRNHDLANILREGFDNVDFDNLKAFFEEGRYLARQRV